MKTIKEYLEEPGGIVQAVSEINNIIDNFDFEAVSATMDALNWDWLCPSDKVEKFEKLGKLTGPPMYHPDIDDIRNNARTLLCNLILERAWKGKQDVEEWFVSTGGFEVSVTLIDDEDRKRLFGEEAPDDFEHSVDSVLKCVVEENLTKYM